MSETVGSSNTFQLSFYDDVSGDALAAPGSFLRDFFPPGRIYTAGQEEVDSLARLPSDGWRRIASRDDARSRAETFAAPCPNEPGAWVFVSMVERDGLWRISSNSVFPERPVPSRARRRRHLRLHWQGTVVVAAGSQPALSLTVTNEGTQRWRNVAGDDPSVDVHVVDPPGGRKPGGYHPYIPRSRQLPDLDPGESVELLQVAWHAHNGADLDISEFPPGRYELVAIVSSLGLRADAGVMHVI